MIRIRLAGGLGNQIFQLGAGLLLAEKSKCKTIIIDDSALSYYKAKHINQLIEFFDVTKSNVNIVFKQSFISKFRLPKLLSFNLPNYPLVSDKNFQTVLKNPNKSLWLDGYFMTCLTQKDFEHMSVLLRSVIKYSPKEMKQDKCVIHIRGGDFLSLGWDKTAPKSYYLDAINVMKKNKVNDFIVVTDDVDYAKSVIIPENGASVVFQSGSIEDDFKMIASYENRILSASTFALWASALGVNNKDCMIIAPKGFNPSIERNFLLPNEICFSKSNF